MEVDEPKVKSSNDVPELPPKPKPGWSIFSTVAQSISSLTFQCANFFSQRNVYRLVSVRSQARG